MASGFTLIELLTVIAVIAVLAGVTFGVSSAIRDSQGRSRAQAEISAITQALEQFKARNGDYPWSSSGYSSNSRGSAIANGEELFQALTGWRKFNTDGNVSFDIKSQSDVPQAGPTPYIDVNRLTYALDSSIELDGIISEYNPQVDLSLNAPDGLVFIDPWGNPYIYIYNKASSSWDNFGFVLYSKGPDSTDVSAGTDGVITDTIRNDSVNADNIYAGE
jgi:prepilin-type N-terminal cleavage/methylation domain-containing protein